MRAYTCKIENQIEVILSNNALDVLDYLYDEYSSLPDSSFEVLAVEPASIYAVYGNEILVN